MFLFRPLPDPGKGVKHVVEFATSYLEGWGYLGLLGAMSRLLCLSAHNPGFYLDANAIAPCRDSPAALSWAKGD